MQVPERKGMTGAEKAESENELIVKRWGKTKQKK